MLRNTWHLTCQRTCYMHVEVDMGVNQAMVLIGKVGARETMVQLKLD